MFIAFSMLCFKTEKSGNAFSYLSLSYFHFSSLLHFWSGKAHRSSGQAQNRFFDRLSFDFLTDSGILTSRLTESSFLVLVKDETQEKRE